MELENVICYIFENSLTVSIFFSFYSLCYLIKSKNWNMDKKESKFAMRDVKRYWPSLSWIWNKKIVKEKLQEFRKVLLKENALFPVFFQQIWYLSYVHMSQ